MSYANDNCDTHSFKPQFDVSDQKNVYSVLLEPYACVESENYSSKEKCSVLEYNDAVSSTMSSCVCNECKTLKKNRNLLKHKIVHTTLRPYICNECKKSYKTKAYLNNHMKIVHSTSRPYTCDECKKSFQRRHTLLLHRRTHSTSKPYACDVCKKSFKDNSNLLRHKKCVHSIVKPYVCDECKKSFKDNSNLLRHKKCVHSIVKPYVCDECKKSFKDNSNLLRHKKCVHSIVKPYVCDECKKSFKENSNLLRHKKTAHTTLRPYVCDECKKLFKESTTLLRHKRTVHTSFYVCDECKKSFDQRYNLLQHKKIHSRLRLYVHDKCEQYESGSQSKSIIDYHLERHNLSESNQKELNSRDFGTNVDSNPSIIFLNNEELANISCIQDQTTDEINRWCNINENNAESEILFSDLNEILRQFDLDSQTEINLLDEELFSQTLSGLSFE